MNIKNEYTAIELRGLVDIFSQKISEGLFLQGDSGTIENIRKGNGFINELKSKCGIYFFVQNGIVKYVGRALPSVGLKSRILNQVNAFGDKNWNKVINDPNVEVAVFIFEDKDQWYFISALEHFLIDKLEFPEFNKRF